MDEGIAIDRDRDRRDGSARSRSGPERRTHVTGFLDDANLEPNLDVRGVDHI